MASVGDTAALAYVEAQSQHDLEIRMNLVKKWWNQEVQWL
jgi:hypothetical protein